MLNRRGHIAAVMATLSFTSGMPASAAVSTAAAASAAATPAATAPSTREQVWAAEVAFARTMAVRDLGKFGDFVSSEAVFFAGSTPLTGKAKVIEGWAGFFKESAPPFSWEPDQVEVLASGTLALSTGPVRDPAGKVVARFNSIWRLEPDGVWRVVFDKGSPVCPDPK
jgi:ketosteroid isomerase-like protein